MVGLNVVRVRMCEIEPGICGVAGSRVCCVQNEALVLSFCASSLNLMLAVYSKDEVGAWLGSSCNFPHPPPSPRALHNACV
jgi:hypothetical protein